MFLEAKRHRKKCETRFLGCKTLRKEKLMYVEVKLKEVEFE